MTGTILNVFQEEMEVVGDDHLQLLARVLTPVASDEKVVLAEIPPGIRKIVALAGSYRKRAEEVKFKLKFDPTSSVEDGKRAIEYDIKASLLADLWWASVREAANAWGGSGKIEIREGWAVVETGKESTTADFVERIRAMFAE